MASRAYTGTATFEGVYFDSTLCLHNADHNADQVGSTGIATATLQPAAVLTNWSTGQWTFVNGQYPKLAWQN